MAHTSSTRIPLPRYSTRPPRPPSRYVAVRVPSKAVPDRRWSTQRVAQSPVRASAPVSSSPACSVEELCEKHARMVGGILAARVPIDDVDDLKQDTLLRAWQSIGTLRDPAKLGGWLASIARNVAREHVRRRPVAFERLPPDVPDRSAAVDREELDHVYRSLGGLPTTFRDTLTLRWLEEMSSAEIAVVTGMRPGSVRVNLHRGMRLLKARLARHGIASES